MDTHVKVTRKMDDEILVAIYRLASGFSRNRKTIFLGAIVGGLVGLGLSLTIPAYYRATTSLVASSAVAETSPTSSALSTLSSLAGGANNPSKELSPFERLQIVLESAGLAESLLDDETARSVLFPQRWDKTAHKWVIRPDIISVLKQTVGLISPGKPDGSVAIAALKKHLSISKDASTGVTELSFVAKDRSAALFMLNLVLKRADDIVRRDYLRVADSYSGYIIKQLPEITNVASRQVLMEQLGKYQQTVVMARVDLPFAELAIDPPHVPVRPAGPSALIYSIVGILAGALLAFILAHIRRNHEKVSARAG